jgi:membrane protein DedA with SNARE-associated domain
VVVDVSIYTSIIEWYNANLNYGTITLLMGLESSFIPFPSEIVVPPAAYKALQPNSNLSLVLVVFFASVGALAGALINYYLSKFLGRPIIYKFADSRIGHFFLLDSSKIKNAEDIFLKHGAITTLVGRLIPGIRQLISIPAGLSGMKLLPFIIYTTIGATFWNILLALLGYFAHGQKDLIDQYAGELSKVLLGLGALFVAYMFFSAFRKKKKISE